MNLTKKTVLILVISTLLLLITSTAIAYYLSGIDEDFETTAEMTTANLGQVEYVTTSPENAYGVLPGWYGEGSTNVYFVTDSEGDVNYECKIFFEEDSYMENIFVQTIDGDDGQLNTESKLTEDGLIISAGTLETETGIIDKGEEHIVRYRIIFKETGEAQNIDQSQTIKTITTCSLETPRMTIVNDEINPKTLISSILKQNTIANSRNDFTTAFTENTTGTIYSTTKTDDNSNVYYYAGNTNNNWVIFGDNGSGTYYYWRIIRTNSKEEGGGVRLLYSGSGNSATTIPANLNNAIVANNVKYNNNSDNSSYVGYMYSLHYQHGYSTDSNIKTQVDSWYANSGLDNFSSQINEDAVYCNDRSVGSGTWSINNAFYYAGYTRVRTNKIPSYKCGGNLNNSYFESEVNRRADKFSASAKVGNGNTRNKLN